MEIDIRLKLINNDTPEQVASKLQGRQAADVCDATMLMRVYAARPKRTAATKKEPQQFATLF